MAIKYQFNKTSLQALEKNLKMRQRTLPIIKSKETALRLEVKKCKEEADILEEKLKQQIAGYESMYALWGEFDASLVSLEGVQLDSKKIAGVNVPILVNISLSVKPFGLFSAPKWYFDGINLLQGLAKTAVEREFVLAKLNLLDRARRKTTQKVNLFEKVQIPGFQEAIRKIKRFMEDEENLSKSSQKILKSLQAKRAQNVESEPYEIEEVEAYD
ncbi:MAG: V-type ATP synthase subunit D [Bacteroidaceae bacterium]|nr:V-type ATP synthase subunit D [Bacteroidaceae bacterium]